MCSLWFCRPRYSQQKLPWITAFQTCLSFQKSRAQQAFTGSKMAERDSLVLFMCFVCWNNWFVLYVETYAFYMLKFQWSVELYMYVYYYKSKIFAVNDWRHCSCPKNSWIFMVVFLTTNHHSWPHACLIINKSLSFPAPVSCEDRTRKQ